MISLSEKTVLLDEIMPLIRERLAAGENVQCSPGGTSMLPMLVPGRDSVVLSPVTGRLHKGDLPLYQRKNGQYILHRVITSGEAYTCCGDNQIDLEQGIEHAQIIAVVSSFTRKGKRISVDAPTYRAYCRFWMASRPVRYVWRRGKGLLKRIARRCIGRE